MPRKIPVILSLEHNFGHGNQNLAMLFAAMNLLAFAFHTVCDCLEDLWIKARNAKRARSACSSTFGRSPPISSSRHGTRS
jgi:hypothetical protein